MTCRCGPGVVSNSSASLTTAGLWQSRAVAQYRSRFRTPEQAVAEALFLALMAPDEPRARLCARLAEGIAAEHRLDAQAVEQWGPPPWNGARRRHRRLVNPAAPATGVTVAAPDSGSAVPLAERGSSRSGKFSGALHGGRVRLATCLLLREPLTQASRAFSSHASHESGVLHCGEGRRKPEWDASLVGG